jgi:anti-sigma factor RsiW
MRAAGSPVNEDDLQARIDGRLPPERAAAVDAYLAEHPEIHERWAQYAEQREALRAAFSAEPGEPIPARLRIGHLRAAKQQRRQRRFGLIAAAIGLFVLGTIGGWAARDVASDIISSGPAGIARAVLDSAIAAHRTFSVEVRHPVEVGAGEEAHLVQWLSKRLGRRLIAPDLAELGFRLMGGRLLPGESGPAALFMYENGKGTRLTCYFLSVQVGGDTEFQYQEQNGVGAFYWIDEGLAYAVAANADRKLLLKVAEIVYQQNSAAGAKAKLPPAPGKPS